MAVTLGEGLLHVVVHHAPPSNKPIAASDTYEQPATHTYITD